MTKIPEIFKIESYNYELPDDKIAKYPASPRDTSKLLVVDEYGNFFERRFRQIVDFLRAGDLLVLNDTRVFPARMYGRKKTGGKVEFLLLENLSPRRWKVLVKPGRRLPVGTVVNFDDLMEAEVICRFDDGSRMVEFSAQDEKFWRILDEIGHIPLPHYIVRDDEPIDRETYQTVYAKNRGAVAAPTAGLHFTEDLLEKIKKMGVEIAYITLNVSWGTFKPIEVSDIREHKMHREYYIISKDATDRINSALGDGRRIIAVGTTTTRALESAANESIPVVPQKRWTDIFIYPTYEFKIVDAMVTNFHLPKSSLIVMVSAFAGIETIMKAYTYALENDFRFYSYGDAMLLFKRTGKP
ncbi:tRNA preQ1(34) S-adenosylmethionine ribosyltransferase-isomerase QueA [bacterium]|nr:tRNA preQ1(34) S-adenosylmethionine ribosyltransferase-isomerase QueA [bacterium]